MKRSEIEQSYKVVNGRIRSPGKFEGEPVWVPHFYDAILDGAASEEGGGSDTGVLAWSILRVTDEDKAEFPELAFIDPKTIPEAA